MNTEEHLSKAMEAYKAALDGSLLAKEMLKQLTLDRNKLEIGFNPGKLHPDLEKELRNFGVGRLIVPLKDEQGRVVNLCAIDDKQIRDDYFYHDKRGLFPMHLQPQHQKIYLAPNMLITAVLYCQGLKKDEMLLSCPNGQMTFEAYLHLRPLLHPTDQVTIISKYLAKSK